MKKVIDRGKGRQSKTFEQRPRMSVKLSFKNCVIQSDLSGLNPFGKTNFISYDLHHKKFTREASKTFFLPYSN